MGVIWGMVGIKLPELMPSGSYFFCEIGGKVIFGKGRGVRVGA